MQNNNNDSVISKECWFRLQIDGCKQLYKQPQIKKCWMQFVLSGAISNK
jgi:hypothetical protein